MIWRRNAPIAAFIFLQRHCNMDKWQWQKITLLKIKREKKIEFFFVPFQKMEISMLTYKFILMSLNLTAFVTICRRGNAIIPFCAGSWCDFLMPCDRFNFLRSLRTCYPKRSVTITVSVIPFWEFRERNGNKFVNRWYLLIVVDIVFIRIWIVIVQHGQRFFRAHGVTFWLILFGETKHFGCSEKYALQYKFSWRKYSFKRTSFEVFFSAKSWTRTFFLRQYRNKWVMKMRMIFTLLKKIWLENVNWFDRNASHTGMQNAAHNR